MPHTAPPHFPLCAGALCLPHHAVVPAQLSQHMHDLNAIVRSELERGEQVRCFYVHPLLYGGLDGVPGADMTPWAHAASKDLAKLAVLCVADIEQWREGAARLRRPAPSLGAAACRGVAVVCLGWNQPSVGEDWDRLMHPGMAPQRRSREMASLCNCVLVVLSGPGLPSIPIFLQRTWSLGVGVESQWHLDAGTRAVTLRCMHPPSTCFHQGLLTHPGALAPLAHSSPASWLRCHTSGHIVQHIPMAYTGSLKRLTDCATQCSRHRSCEHRVCDAETRPPPRHMHAESISSTLGPGRPVLATARAVPIHEEMRKWLRGGMRPIALQAALENVGTLLRDGTLTISHDVDFGQCDLAQHQLPPAEHQTMQGWAAQMPELEVQTAITTFTFSTCQGALLLACTCHGRHACSGMPTTAAVCQRACVCAILWLVCCAASCPAAQPSMACMCAGRGHRRHGVARSAAVSAPCSAPLSLTSPAAVQAARSSAELLAWLGDAASVSARSVQLTNSGTEPLFIVDLGMFPNTRGLFFILDQHRLWRRGARDGHAPTDQQCLSLPPGMGSPPPHLFTASPSMSLWQQSTVSGAAYHTHIVQHRFGCQRSPEFPLCSRRCSEYAWVLKVSRTPGRPDIVQPGA